MSQLSRRDFLAAAGTAGVCVLAPGPSALDAFARRAPALLRGGRFEEGILSGDPTPTGITLATRLVGVEGPGAVTLELARDAGFDKGLVRSRLVTNGALGHAVKARVTGLEPHQRYWYRFSGRNAESRVGRFRTALPSDSRQPVRFGIFTGQELTTGYFNAQALLADEDVDFVLNLGNYICADQAFPRPDGVRAVALQAAATTLGEYRRRYREYRRDAGLRDMHAAHTMISTWDDREVAAGYAGSGAAGDGYGSLAELIAYRAWFEAMPHYPKADGAARIYHRPQFGRTLDLFVLDTRQYRKDPQCDNGGDPACLRRGSPGDLLGAQQSRHLRRSLKRSNATWKVVATPSPVSIFRDRPDHFYDYDSWQGYPGEREDLLATIRAYDVRGVVFASGNRRRFIASEVLDSHDRVIAPEFTCGSVTQRTDAEVAAARGAEGFGTLADVTQPPDETERLRLANPSYSENDQLHHGYAVCSVTRDSLTMRFRKVAAIRYASEERAPGSRYTLRQGRQTI